MKFLITGGEGFVGSALCHTLAERCHEVTSIDNHFNNCSRPRHQYVDYIVADCKDILNTHLKDKSFDYIFHLGEYARVEQSFDDFEKVIDYNLKSFPVMLQFAKDKGAKFIYSGSSTKFAVGEEGRAQSPYAYTKAQNTELLQNYANWYDLDYTIVYFYNVYGPGENGIGRFATVVEKFLQLTKDGAQTLPVTSPGTQLRNFTHIDDIISGLIRAGIQGDGDEYGIGCDDKYSILDLVNMLGCTADMTPEKAGNRMDGVLKTDKLKSLGWSAENDLKTYIKGELK